MERPVIMVDIPSPVPSATVIDLTSPIPSTSTMPPILPIKMPPVPSTSRHILENCYDFRLEEARRSSFRNWPVSFIDPVSLAAAGFYYTGNLDVVRCFECQLVASQWSVGDIPMQIHEMCSPECRFIRNERCNNVPIGASPAKVPRTKRRNRNISCPHGLQYQESFDFNDHGFLRSSRTPTAYQLSRLGLKSVKKPEILQYASYESRLNSFATWPTDVTQPSEELAHAGFYYTGINDFTTCYHCGICIGNWRPEDDPWDRHMISSPRCYHLLPALGWEYVNNVTDQELYETAEGAPIESTDENPERSNSENVTNEMTLVEKINILFTILATLEEENRPLKDARSCKVCTEREATITFLPCGHLATCQYCSPAFTTCIICRRKVKAITHTFFA
ncbi:baculoviral IAP repeat-containing protein 3-like isoform X1 [Bombus huntii]|uniref:baculoviral IAP repeat-containing protein 3-like isoform X1 n=1 Tax=Bombus huntii TaxID=85661 RepID=UPI0021A9DDD3|nr:baculoviral IAP repeat-containing protein 3-like isoform X1 [Bombus huntii]